MKFGGKATVQSRMATAEEKRNGRPVKTKDISPTGNPKIKPVVGKGRIGVKAVWKF